MVLRRAKATFTTAPTTAAITAPVTKTEIRPPGLAGIVGVGAGGCADTTAVVFVGSAAAGLVVVGTGLEGVVTWALLRPRSPRLSARRGDTRPRATHRALATRPP